MSKPFANFECNKIIKAGNIDSNFYLENLQKREYKVLVATPNELTEYDAVFLVQGAKEKFIVILQFNEKFMTKILASSQLQLFDRDYLKLISGR